MKCDGGYRNGMGALCTDAAHGIKTCGSAINQAIPCGKHISDSLLADRSLRLLICRIIYNIRAKNQER